MGLGRYGKARECAHSVTGVALLAVGHLVPIAFAWCDLLREWRLMNTRRPTATALEEYPLCAIAGETHCAAELSGVAIR
jgi:hypothetical protein